MQRPAPGRQGVDAPGNFRVFNQRRRVVRLAPRIDDERPAAAPVLLFDNGADAVNIGRGVRARERRPQPIVQRPRGELAVVDHDHERKAIDGIVLAVAAAKAFDCRIFASLVGGKRRPGNRQHAGQGHARIGKAVRQPQFSAQFARQLAPAWPAAAMATFEPSFKRPPE